MYTEYKENRRNFCKNLQCALRPSVPAISSKTECGGVILLQEPQPNLMTSITYSSQAADILTATKNGNPFSIDRLIAK